MRRSRYVALAVAALTCLAAAAGGSAHGSVEVRPSGAAKCARGQTPALISGQRRCLAVGQRCKTADDRLYHRYGLHCVSGRLARKHPTPQPPAPAEHVIGVRVANGAGEFYDRRSGERFVPRGNNFERRADLPFEDGTPMITGSTFVVGRYDAAAAGAALSAMHEQGYNVVRVFLDMNCQEGCLGGPRQGLSSTYLENVVDFLKQAKTNAIYVMLVADAPPASTSYDDAIYQNDLFANTNAFYLPPGGVVQGFEAFWQDLIRTLVRLGAPLDAIWAYSLANEAHFVSDARPLSLSSSVVATANGKSYDMSNAAQKQAMMDEGLVYWIDHVRAAIRQVDPTALVTIGFFWPQGPNRARVGDPRVIRTGPVIAQSQADFIDLHLYPGLELTLPQYVQNYELPQQTAKPIVMGEFGAFQFAYPAVPQAAAALRAWQADSCRYGFDGWLLWTWDTVEAAGGEPAMWQAISGGGVIGQTLAPKTRPDPCS